MKTKRVATAKPMLFALALTSCACNNTKVGFTEVKETDVTIQVMKVKDHQNPETIDLRVRIYPAKQFAEKSELLRDKMWYGIDSSFFLSSGRREKVPLMAQPIANGMKNCFEYLLLFEEDSKSDNNNLSLVYKDKYFTGKIYKINLSNN